VEQTRNKQIKNSCILLVVIDNYTSDARTHECQMNYPSPITIENDIARSLSYEEAIKQYAAKQVL
jgi:hypothetical protein